MQPKLVKLNTLVQHEDNPRQVDAYKYEKLLASLREFPEMMKLRPFVIDENNIILGGNMKFKACQELGITEVWVKVAEGLTDEQKLEFVIKDNISFGDWDYSSLEEFYDMEKFNDFNGVNQINYDDLDYSDFDDMEDGVVKALHIKIFHRFELVDAISTLRKANYDIGGIFINALQEVVEDE